MKSILSTLLLLSTLNGFGQQSTKTSAHGQHSTVDLTGNSNIIKVIQGNIVNIYDLQNEKQADEFLKYIRDIPGINDKIKMLLQYDRKVLDLVKKIHKKIGDESLFNADIFLGKLDEYIRENERLRIQINQLAVNDGQEGMLKKANELLLNYDNQGYQNLFEEYKKQERKKINLAKKSIASASYLQAENNCISYNYKDALKQINEAIENDPDNVHYLLKKVYILRNLYEIDKCVSIFEQILVDSKDDTVNADCYYNLGVLYLEQSNNKKAIECYNKAMAIYTKLFQNEDSTVGNTYARIADVFYYDGNYDKAIEYYTKALFIQEKALGKEHREVATSYHNIGAAFSAKSDYTKSMEYFHKSLRLKEKTGGNPISVSTSYNCIAEVYKSMGIYDSAREYYSKAISIQEKLLGSAHPTVAGSFNDIGTLYEEVGNYDSAMIYASKALDIYINVFGLNHLSTANSYVNIGLAYYDKGIYDTAIIYYYRALNIEEEKLGMKHPSLAITYNNIGLAYYEEKNYSKALGYYQKALVIQEKTLGRRHPNTGASYNNIATVCVDQGNYVEACKYYSKAITTTESVLGKNHRSTQNVYFNASIAYILNNRKKDAKRCLNQVNILSVYMKASGFNNLGMSYFKDGKYKEAISFWVVSKELIESCDTPKTNPIWASIYQNLAEAYCIEGRRESARALYEKALRFCEENKQEPLTDKIKKNYAGCL